MAIRGTSVSVGYGLDWRWMSAVSILQGGRPRVRPRPLRGNSCLGADIVWAPRVFRRVAIAMSSFPGWHETMQDPAGAYTSLTL